MDFDAASANASLMTPVPRAPQSSFLSPRYSPLISPERLPPPSFLDASPPLSPMLQAGRVASLASEFMLMEYAAELKGLAQLSLKRGVRAAQQLPREISEAAIRIRSHAVRIVATLRAELVELTSGRASRAQAGQIRRIRNAHTHLQAATELLNQTEQRTVSAVKKRRQSSMVYRPAEQASPTVVSADAPAAPPMPTKAAAVTNLAAMMASFTIPPPSSTAVAAPAIPAAPAPAVDAGGSAATKNLLEQIAMLKAQMETMARLQAMMPHAAAAVKDNMQNGTSAAVASSGPAIPLAPTIGTSRMSTVPVPQAPELTADSFFFTGRVAASGTVISPAAPDAPSAPPMTPVSTRAAAPQRPAMSAVLGQITDRANLKSANAANINNGSTSTPAKKRQSMRKSGGGAAATSTASIVAAVTSRATSASAAPVLANSATGAPIKVFVRKLPGANDGSMSLTDGIKMASVVKLRPTQQERSPGGTPVRDMRAVLAASNPTQGLLKSAFAARFALANGGGDVTHKQKSSNSQQQSGVKRRPSFDKENWETE